KGSLVAPPVTVSTRFGARPRAPISRSTWRANPVVTCVRLEPADGFRTLPSLLTNRLRQLSGVEAVASDVLEPPAAPPDAPVAVVIASPMRCLSLRTQTRFPGQRSVRTEAPVARCAGSSMLRDAGPRESRHCSVSRARAYISDRRRESHG